MKQEDIVKIRCPRCGRYLAEGKGYVKSLCRECGSEVTYRSKEERADSIPIARMVRLTAS